MERYDSKFHKEPRRNERTGARHKALRAIAEPLGENRQRQAAGAHVEARNSPQNEKTRQRADNQILECAFESPSILPETDERVGSDARDFNEHIHIKKITAQDQSVTSGQQKKEECVIGRC